MFSIKKLFTKMSKAERLQYELEETQALMEIEIVKEQAAAYKFAVHGKKAKELYERANEIRSELEGVES